MYIFYIVCLVRIFFGLLESKLIIEKKEESVSFGFSVVGNCRDWRVRVKIFDFLCDF